MEFNILLKFVGLMPFILSLFGLINIQGKDLYLCDFIKKKFDIGL